MNCKYCGAGLEDGATVCTICGKAQTDGENTEEMTAAEVPAAETTAAENPATEGTNEEPAAEEPADETAKQCGRTEPCAECDALPGCDHAGEYFADELAAQKKAKKSGAKRIVLGIVAGVLVIALVATLLVCLLPGGKTEQTPDEAPASESSNDTAQQDAPDAPAADDGSVVHTNDFGYTSYTATAEQLTDSVLGTVVATCADSELTNREMGLYYWQQYYSFASAYGSYLSYFMDTSLGLDEQLYGENVTWQQQFIDRAFLMFHHIAALAQEAEAAGFTLSDEEQAYLDTFVDNMTEAAVGYGYESADEFLQLQFGPGVTVQEYADVVADNLLASAYLQSLVDAHSYTDDDVSAYYDAHAEEYEANGVQKLDVPNIDIRHILIVPQEQNEDGTYTDEAWQLASEQAEAILQQWIDGESTEESFAELAVNNSADGSASNGGLITDVYPGQMVEEFNDWCFDPARRVGDVGIVKTKFGYHVMYFSAVSEEIYWRTVAERDYLNEFSATIEDEIAAKYALTTNLDNVAIYDVMAANAQ